MICYSWISGIRQVALIVFVRKHLPEIQYLKTTITDLEKKFPESRRKAYYLMAIHERLPKRIHSGLKQLGWTKAKELARVARSEGENFDCAPWVHKASTMPKEEFRREVDRYLTGKETEPWELLYFKVYKSQLPIIERAFETAALMLGSDKSRGYCLEMICADFLAGAHLDDVSPDTLSTSLKTLITFLPQERRAELLERLQTGA